MAPKTIICPICDFRQPNFDQCVNCGAIFSKLFEVSKKKESVQAEELHGPLKSIEENTSGGGKTAIIPPEIKGWNWGAFLLNFIWAIGNRTWIGLFSILPIVGYVMPIILGYKGSEWAWRNKRWESIDHFKSVQRSWAVWGTVVMILLLVSFAGLFYLVLHPGEQSLEQVL
ncbi:hypothetical protein D3OALGA1CA_2362 [Olavius algarvensis associated proteobacterium Delta 3]|nr:hypothetical protein D3OALGB2SA_264 [Olavius algarvensis associated proteobacterium Delta 3]CAB5117469.1 hypothetical protein D3OALGA1CA_2362 [Olavius algarvensis associated proteobacterium Delta 3]